MNRNKPNINKKTDSGQSLVLVAIMFFGFVVIAALIIDGGSLYLNRRNAQTAVDAAAMAGAYEKCIMNGSFSDIQSVANGYAVNQNEATQIESVTISADGQVEVRARIDTPSFFSVVLGFDTNTAYAEASAGCFSPGKLANLLPITWTCRPPAGGSVDDPCNVQSIPSPIFDVLRTFFNFNNDLLDEGDGVSVSSYHDNLPGEGKIAYLVMDSDKFDPEIDCEELNPSGEINCDFNDDGVLEVNGGANRGWLLLDGNGASDLKDIMLNGFPTPISIPQWFPGKNGVSNSVFISANTIEMKVVLVPIFTAICDDTKGANIPTNCPTEYEVGDLIREGSGKGTYYRVAGFAPFVITCVSKGNPDICPAKTFSNVKHNVSTIEGYFLSGYYAGDDIDPNGFDLGVYTISLTK
jgi:hypothetical protein